MQTRIGDLAMHDNHESGRDTMSGAALAGAPGTGVAERNDGSRRRGTALGYDIFDGALLPTTESYALWRESLKPLFDARIDDPQAKIFRATAESYDLQQTVFARSTFPESAYYRRLRYGVDDGADPLLVQLYVSGGYRGHNGHREMTVGAGDIGLLDLGYEMATHAEASGALSLVIPRELLPEQRQLPYGGVLSGKSPMGAILGNHMLTVWRQLGGVDAASLALVNEMLVVTVASAFSSLREGAEKALASMPERPRLEAICAFIQHNLHRDDLSPEFLCDRFGFSRARLYRLFAPFGGVAGYIREARLRRCYDELAYPGTTGRPRRVIDVAMRWGFTSQSHFSRLFRRAFDIAPGDLLAMSEALARERDPAMPETPATGWAVREWLNRLCRQIPPSRGDGDT